MATGIPAAIGCIGAAWFAFSRALDPPLLWFTLAAVLAWLAGIVFLVAIVLACFRSTRALGVGYMVGTAIGTFFGVIGFAVLSLVATVGDVVAR